MSESDNRVLHELIAKYNVIKDVVRHLPTVSPTLAQKKSEMCASFVDCQKALKELETKVSGVERELSGQPDACAMFKARMGYFECQPAQDILRELLVKLDAGKIV